jgi:hypothetical protein
MKTLETHVLFDGVFRFKIDLDTWGWNTFEISIPRDSFEPTRAGYVGALKNALLLAKETFSSKYKGCEIIYLSSLEFSEWRSLVYCIPKYKHDSYIVTYRALRKIIGPINNHRIPVPIRPPPHEHSE